MKRLPLMIALAAGLMGAAPVSAAPARIIPAPAVETPREGAFRLTARTPVLVPAGDEDARAAADRLVDLLARSRGLKLSIRDGAPTAGAIAFTSGDAKGEAYSLDVTPDRIVVSSSGAAGLFYGATTVWQLATQRAGQGAATIDATRIEDAPRFAWRGLMLDTARHYQSPEFVKGFIDRMAMAKLNTFHWHLTDDQGWRIEIKKYPRLTQVGAWRVPAGPGPAADIDPKTGKPRVIGGFYTQDQVREIVAYAAARHITIVPEIDVPGHARAAIVAYPELGSVQPAPTENSGDWGVFPYLYNVEEPTFAFLTDVLNEVMDLFPGPYVHLGGDEAVKDQWKASPQVQARMKALHIADEAALQGWFMGRMQQVVAARGRKLIGWDEILEGGITKGATVMSWRGTDGAIVAAKMGHDTVLSPAPTLYLDHRQSPSPDEPPGRGAVMSWKDVYEFEPVPAALNDDERRHVLGVQGNLWTEHVRTADRVEAMVFPRAAMIAETGWSPASAKRWDSFADRLPVELDRYRAMGEGFDAVPLQVHALASPEAGGARVTLAGADRVGEIRYTLDGSTPTSASTLYNGPFVTAAKSVRAAAFRNGVALATPTRFDLDARSIRTRSSQELGSCAGKLLLNLEDDAPTRGEYAVFLTDILQPCWVYKDADLTGVSQLEVAVGQRPFNFQIGDDIKAITFRPPATAEGELEVRDACDGPVLATLPLAPAARSNGVTVIRAPLSGAGAKDLCFTFTQKGPDPMWSIDRVTLVVADGR